MNIPRFAHKIWAALKAQQNTEESIVNLPSGEDIDFDFARVEIASSLQWWLDFNASGFDDDLQLNSSIKVMPPEWPSRGVLENWIAVLNHNIKPTTTKEDVWTRTNV